MASRTNPDNKMMNAQERIARATVPPPRRRFRKKLNFRNFIRGIKRKRVMTLKEFIFYSCKILEVIIASCCIGLMFYPMREISETKREYACVWMVAFGATLFISLTLIIADLIEGTMTHKWAMFIFLLCNSILNCVAGCLILRDWDEYGAYTGGSRRAYFNMMLSAGTLALFNTFIHLTELVCAFFVN